MGFLLSGEGAATRRLPWLRYGSHYLVVEICHRWTFAKCDPKFSGWKKTLKIGKYIRSAVVLVWGRLELNNIRNDSSNSQPLSVLSVKRDQFETRSIRNKRGRMFRPLRFRGRTRELLSSCYRIETRTSKNSDELRAIEKAYVVVTYSV